MNCAKLYKPYDRIDMTTAKLYMPYAKVDKAYAKIDKTCEPVK